MTDADRDRERKQRESMVRAAIAYRKAGGKVEGDDWAELIPEMDRSENDQQSQDRIGFKVQR